jgi:cell division transport system permease protein
MAGNGHIIEVLHFVGAEASFIAREFRRQFLITGIKGAASGGLSAIVVFIVFSWWTSRNMATPQADQASALFGNFAIGSAGYLGVALMVLIIAALTAATTHATVIAYLSDLDQRQTEG